MLDQKVFAPASGLECGAYILADLGRGIPAAILMASGSEVSLIVEAGQHLAGEGLAVRLVSFPSWELFESQEPAYQESVLPAGWKARLAVEAGVSQGWSRWVGEGGRILAVDHFGASAPYKTLYSHYGLTVDAIIAATRALLQQT